MGLEDQQEQGNGKDEMRGSLHYGGKCAASGRDDERFWWYGK